MALLFCCGLLPAVSAVGPTVTFSTFLGIADCDDIAIWREDILLACHSPETRLPLKITGVETAPGAMNAYVVRLNTKTRTIVYATRIGGNAFTAAFRIRVDGQGFAYATGLTKASNFPTTSDAVQRRFGGGDSDAFLVKLGPSGQVVYSTFLGGTGADQGNGLELDGKGGVLVGGTTWSPDFPGLQNPRYGGAGDFFVSYLRPGEPAALRSTVLGGAGEEKLTGLAVDGRGGLFVVGYTKSTDFPVVDPMQSELRGVSDLFLTRLKIPDLMPTWSTFFGGSGDDSGWGVAVDRNGNPIVAGITGSRDLPSSRDAFQHQSGGGLDAFIAKFEGTRYRTVTATYFGGTKDDSSGYDGQNIQIDANGNVWLAGLTNSLDLPTRNAMQPAYGGGDGDGFLAAFSPKLTNLCYGTYRGGSGRDLLEGVATSAQGRVFATGLTFSDDLPMPKRSLQPRLPIKIGTLLASTMVLGLHAQGVCP